MNIAVIGLGSMGKRRIRLLESIDEKINIFGVDSREDRRVDAETNHSVSQTFVSINELLSKVIVDAALVCTSPVSHAEIISKLLNNKIHVFTEINLVQTDYTKNVSLAEKFNKILFLSSTFLYREEIKYIQSVVDKQDEIINYNYHVGQYLPDWHPWESYKDFFVNNKKTNGCREIFAIELPWIVLVFGPIQSVIARKGKMSKLDIDYPDNYQVIIKHQNGNSGCMSVDVVSRKPVRNLEVFSENCHISWDGSPRGIYNYDFINKTTNNVDLYEYVDQDNNYSNFIVENAYKNEVVAFIDAIKSGINNNYNFNDDQIILDWIDVIENEN